MDWFSWLSRTSLDSSVIYEYGLAFTRNELQKEDLTYFNHEFLQSMGISVAKHRLEILKLARKEVGASPRSLSKLVLAINKTKKSIAKCINKWVFQEVETTKALRLPAPTDAGGYQEKWNWKGPLRRKHKSNQKELQLHVDKPIPKPKRIAKSGPLDGRMAQEKLILTNRSLKLSGPLDRNMQERFLFTYRSPVSSGPLDGRMYVNKSPKLSGPSDRWPPSPRIYTDYCKEKFGGGGGGGFDDQTLWATLFQDLKPT